MISPGTNRFVIFVVLAAICAPTGAGEPNQAPIQLAFEISPTALGPFSPLRPVSVDENLWYSFASLKPAYAAAIALLERSAPPRPGGAQEAEYLPRPGRMSAFLSFAEQEAGLSERQKAFLRAARALYQDYNALGVDRPDPNGPQRLLLYAMTLEDAQKMAQAYFQYAMNEARRRVAPYERHVQSATEEIATEEKRLSEVDKLIETTRKSLEDFQKTVPYRTESEAHQAIGELDRMLNATQVEIAGMKTRMAAIQGYQQGQEKRGGMSQEAVARLDMMFIEESIALQGAGARERMATRLREQANRFIDLKSTLASASGEKKTLTESLNLHRMELASSQRPLEAAKRREPRLPDKVIIHPVKWVDDVPGSN